MADKDFVVKNGLVVNTAFTANSTLVNATAINVTNQVNAASIYAVSNVRIGTSITANLTGFYAPTGIVSSNGYLLGSNLTVNTSGIYHTGTVNAASYTVGVNFEANSTGVYHGGTVNAATISVGASSFLNDTGIYTTGTVNATLITTTSVTINTTAVRAGSNSFINTTAYFVGNSTTNTTITAGNIALHGTTFIVNSVGVYHGGTISIPSTFVTNSTGIHYGTIGAANGYFSNTSNITLGNSSVSISINSSSFSGTSNNSLRLGGILAAVYVQNAESRVISGNIEFTGSNNYFTLGMKLGPDSFANNGMVYIANSSSNTTITQGRINLNAGATVANSLGVYTTGTVNASLITTTGVTINTIAVAATANSYINSSAYYVTNSSFFTTIKPGEINVDNDVIANSSGVFVTGTAVVNSAQFQVGTSTIANSLGVFASRFNIVSAFNANSTGVFIADAANAAQFQVGSSFVANSTILRGNLNLVVSGSSSSTGEGGQVTLGYGNNLATNIVGGSDNTFNIDVTGGTTTPLLRFYARSSATTTPAMSIANTGRVHVGAITEQTDSTFKVTGTANVTSNARVGGALTVASTLGVTGAATIGGTLDVTGNLTVPSISGSSTLITVSTNTSFTGTIYASNGSIGSLSIPSDLAACGYLFVDSVNGVGIGAASTTAGLSLSVSGTYSVAQANVLHQTLSDSSGTISWNGALGQIATVTLTGTGRTMANPTNRKVGTYILHILQDATGSRTITTWGSAYKFPAGVDPVLTTTANARDIVSFVSDGTYLYGSFLPDVK